MNDDRLLAHYHRIADAPDAIARLRRLILDLAVRGKLVPQDPKDEPASELLERIAKEKTRLVMAGEIKKVKPLPPISQDEQPFDLPFGWVWTRLGDLIHLVSGQHLQPPEYSEDPKVGLPYITGPSDFAAEGLKITRFALVRKAVAKKGQLLLTVKGSGVGKTTTCDIPEVAISRQLMALTAIAWDDRFLVLITHRLAEKLQEEARSLIPGISREDVEEFVFPLPPLAEQHRIVAKVHQLMVLCDRLEAARMAREAKRDRLTAASLARLNAPDPDTFQADARFALGALAALTSRPDQIKQLRQTILNLAVRGKLVPQDPDDAPMTITLRNAVARRAAFVKAKKVRAKKLDGLDDLAADTDLPSSWALERLGNLVDPENTISYGVLVPGEEVPNGIPFVRAQDLTLSGHPDRPNKTIAPEIEKAYARTRLRGGEILVCVVGSIGKLGIVPRSWAGANIARAVARILPIPDISREYLLIVLRGEPVQTYFTETTRTLAQPTLNVGLIEQTPIPLPPLAEQHRIVAKVDALMALCDRLEASLTSSTATRRRLLDALLAEALAPVDAREMEAAE